MHLFSHLHESHEYTDEELEELDRLAHETIQAGEARNHSTYASLQERLLKEKRREIGLL